MAVAPSKFGCADPIAIGSKAAVHVTTYQQSITIWNGLQVLVQAVQKRGTSCSTSSFCRPCIGSSQWCPWNVSENGSGYVQLKLYRATLPQSRSENLDRGAYGPKTGHPLPYQQLCQCANRTNLDLPTLSRNSNEFHSKFEHRPQWIVPTVWFSRAYLVKVFPHSSGRPACDNEEHGSVEDERSIHMSTGRLRPGRCRGTKRRRRKIFLCQASTMVPGTPSLTSSVKGTSKTSFVDLAERSLNGTGVMAEAWLWRLVMMFRLEKGSQKLFIQIGSRLMTWQHETTLTPIIGRTSGQSTR